jgi:hypothetical protein
MIEETWTNTSNQQTDKMEKLQEELLISEAKGNKELERVLDEIENAYCDYRKKKAEIIVIKDKLFRLLKIEER